MQNEELNMGNDIEEAAEQEIPKKEYVKPEVCQTRLWLGSFEQEPKTPQKYIKPEATELGNIKDLTYVSSVDLYWQEWK